MSHKAVTQPPQSTGSADPAGPTIVFLCPGETPMFEHFFLDRTHAIIAKLMKRSRFPGIIDVTVEDRAEAIRAAATDPELDRGYRKTGPLLNRLRIRDVLGTLRLDDRAFPTVMPRTDRVRADERDLLWNRLNEIAPVVAQGPAELEGLAAFVRGAGDPEQAGPMVQQLVGRLFTPDYRSSTQTWAAALTLGRAAGSANPILHLWWRVNRRVQHAREILAAPVGSDLAAVNATGIALHHIVRGIQEMHEIYKDPSQRDLEPKAAALRCLFAPTVIRQPVATSSQRPGGHPLVMLDLHTAFKATQDPDLVFLRNSWSVCPGEGWVPALLEGIWRRANNDYQ